MSRHDRWWIRGANLRTLKKYFSGAYQDGVWFNFTEWDCELNNVRRLRPGQKILSPYMKDQWNTVKEISWGWQSIQRIRYIHHLNKIVKGRAVGQWISGFTIITEEGTLHYESPELLRSFLPDAPIVPPGTFRLRV